MEIRLKKEKDEGVTDQVKAVKREVAHIFTKGTHFKLDFDQKTALGDYDTKYVLSFYQTNTTFGYCYFDMSTLKFYLGQFEDDFTLKQFRTLVMQTRPVEFVCTSGAADHTNIRG
jgi:DNA mismatch repair ATPase MutS